MKHKFLLKTMLLLFALVAGSTSAWADTATITFTSSSGVDSNTALTTSNFVSSGIQSSDVAFGTISCSATAKCYNGKKGYGLKAVASSSAGSFTISFSTPITNVSKITLNRASYSDSKATYITVKNGDTKLANAVETPSGSAAFADMDITGLSIASLGSLTVETGRYCYIKSITVTYTSSISHTLSYEVSPSATGTVVLGATSVAEGSTTSITATPIDGYRFVNWTVTGTGSRVESTTSATTTFTMGTADATVTANFEAIPTHTLSSAVSPVGAGTVTLGATSVREGSTTTASVAANAGYKFTGWSISGAGATLSSTTDNPTTVTMGTANATVTATFTAVKTYEINWSVNGVIVKTENMEENAAISFDDPTSGVPTGYTFKGWVTEANKIVGTTNTDPKANYVTSATSTANVTYYAVLAIETPTPYTAHLTGDEIASNFAATAQAYGDAEKSYTDTSDGMTWSARCSTNAARHWIQIKNDADTYIEAAAAGAITEVKVKISNSTNSSGGIDDITKHGAFSGNVKLDNAQGTNTGTYGSASSSAIVDNILTITPSKSSSTLYIHVDAAARIWNVDVTYNNVTSSHFCTTVSDVPVSVTTDSYATFASELPLDFTSSSINAYIAIAKGDKSGVTFTQVKKVPANTGVLLYKDGGASEYIPVLDGAANDVTGNKFVKGTGATVASDDGENYNYILNKVSSVVGFYKANDKKVAANRAYISIPKASGIKEFFSIDFEDDDADGIETVDNRQQTTDDSPIYNLAGQRISKMQKGINIINGKKILK